MKESNIVHKTDVTGEPAPGEHVNLLKQKTAYEIMPSLVGSEMCIRDRHKTDVTGEPAPGKHVNLLKKKTTPDEDDVSPKMNF